MEKKNLTVADILNTSANNNVLCYMYDETHQVDESVTEAEISNGECTYDWATATVTYWHVTDEGNLEFSAELQNFDKRPKYGAVAEDLSLIRDIIVQTLSDLKSTDGPWTEDTRNAIKKLRKTKIAIMHLILAVNMAMENKATITPIGWLNMIAVCEPIRSIDVSLINILVADVMAIYTADAMPAIYNLTLTDIMKKGDK